jgi:hypothetical protein
MGDKIRFRFDAANLQVTGKITRGPTHADGAGTIVDLGVVFSKFPADKVFYPCIFFYNFDKLDYLKTEREKDAKHRRLLLQATKELVEGGNE